MCYQNWHSPGYHLAECRHVPLVQISIEQKTPLTQPKQCIDLLMEDTPNVLPRGSVCWPRYPIICLMFELFPQGQVYKFKLIKIALNLTGVHKSWILQRWFPSSSSTIPQLGYHPIGLFQFSVCYFQDQLQTLSMFTKKTLKTFCAIQEIINVAV